MDMIFHLIVLFKCFFKLTLKVISKTHISQLYNASPEHTIKWFFKLTFWNIETLVTMIWFLNRVYSIRFLEIEIGFWTLLILILILGHIGMISSGWHLVLPPKRAMPNYLTCGIIDTLSNVRHFNHLKWSERPQLLNDESGRDRPVI